MCFQDSAGDRPMRDPHRIEERGRHERFQRRATPPRWRPPRASGLRFAPCVRRQKISIPNPAAVDVIQPGQIDHHLAGSAVDQPVDGILGITESIAEKEAAGRLHNRYIADLLSLGFYHAIMIDSTPDRGARRSGVRAPRTNYLLLAIVTTAGTGYFLLRVPFLDPSAAPGDRPESMISRLSSENIRSRSG